MNPEISSDNQSEYQDVVEAKDNVEALKADFLKLCHSLKDLVSELQQQGAEGNQLAKGLFLEECLHNLKRPEKERGFDSDFGAVQKDKEITAPNFISRWLYGYSGAINYLGKAYLRVKTFYSDDRRFSAFIENFSHFIESVNKNNTECKIPPLPELLVPMDENIFELHQAPVERSYPAVPSVRQVVRKKLAEQARNSPYLIIDLETMPLVKLGLAKNQGLK